MALNEGLIFEALKQVYDPEIPVDVVNLGLVYEVKIDGGKVHVKMTTTAQGCPVADYIARQAQRVIQRLEGVEEAHVEMVYDPPWSLERVSEEGKNALGWGKGEKHNGESSKNSRTPSL